MRGSFRVVVAGCTAACALSIPSAAHAGDVDFQLTAGAGVSWVRKMPSLKTTSVTPTIAREGGEGEVAIGGSLAAFGGGIDLGFTVEDRWVVPVLGFAGYGAVGSYDAVATSLDGSIAHVRPWSAYEVDLLLPGVGYRVKRRRFLFSALVRTGVVWLAAQGSVAAGVESVPISLVGISGLVQAELEACRRLDPVTRVCLQVSPRIYDFGFMNGATFGLRVEWGR